MRLLRLLPLTAAMFIVATNGFVIAGLLPQIARDFGVHSTEVGLAITIYAATVAIAAPAASILLARVSRTVLLVGGLALIAAGTIVAAAAPDLAVFIVGRAVAALGGAAVVPVGIAAAASTSAPDRRGRAIGFVVAGFTAATAFGAPLGTGLAALGGWRVPLLVLAGLAVAAAVAIAMVVIRVPIDAPVGVRRRFTILADLRLLLAVLTTVFTVAAFNCVYIFSSAVTHEATGGDTAVLAALLLTNGVAGLAGNIASGHLIDRLGSRRTATLFITGVVAVLASMPVVVGSLPGAFAAFAVWGFVSSGTQPAVQHRQVTVDPAVAGVAVSWNSTALYTGIAIAPPIAGIALHAGGAQTLPWVGAVAAGIGLVLFQLSWVARGATAAPR